MCCFLRTSALLLPHSGNHGRARFASPFRTDWWFGDLRWFWRVDGKPRRFTTKAPGSKQPIGSKQSFVFGQPEIWDPQVKDLDHGELVLPPRIGELAIKQADWVLFCRSPFSTHRHRTAQQVIPKSAGFRPFAEAPVRWFAEIPAACGPTGDGVAGSDGRQFLDFCHFLGLVAISTSPQLGALLSPFFGWEGSPY